MSRYAWPGSKKKGHSGAARVEWDMRTSGLMTERAVSSARDAQALAGSALRAPGNDAGLWIPIGPAGVLNGGIVGNPRVTGEFGISPSVGTVRACMQPRPAAASGTRTIRHELVADRQLVRRPPTISSFVRSANALSCGCLLVTFGTAADGSGDDVYVGTGEIRGVNHRQAFRQGCRRGSPAPRITVGRRSGGSVLVRLEARGAKPCRTRDLPARPRPERSEPARAATDIGLFTRAQGFQVDRNWTRVKKGPLDFDADDDKVDHRRAVDCLRPLVHRSDRRHSLQRHRCLRLDAWGRRPVSTKSISTISTNAGKRSVSVSRSRRTMPAGSTCSRAARSSGASTGRTVGVRQGSEAPLRDRRRIGISTWR